jgi:AcrR family transcriptional regulator
MRRPPRTPQVRLAAGTPAGRIVLGVARTPDPQLRERVLDTAARLFYRDGVRAVGLQQVIDEAGVGKSSVYRQFASKDDLVAAWLNRSRAAWWERAARIAERDPDPAHQLLELVGAVYDEIADPGFNGCRFLNTSNEFRDPDHAGHRESVEHLREIHEQFASLARQAGADDPGALADELVLIVDGMYANGAVLGPGGPAGRGVSAAAERIAARTGVRVERQAPV